MNLFWPVFAAMGFIAMGISVVIHRDAVRHYKMAQADYREATRLNEELIAHAAVLERRYGPFETG